MRTLLSGLLILGVLVAVTAVTHLHGTTQVPILYRYMILRFEEDTAAHNAVAAILLNYRMYDTMFEALILLTAIIGMKQFLPAETELKNVENGGKQKR